MVRLFLTSLAGKSLIVAGVAITAAACALGCGVIGSLIGLPLAAWGAYLGFKVRHSVTVL